MWQKNGTGPIYKSMWVYDNSGGKTFVLVATRKNKKGESYKNVEANSWQMLVKSGWKKVG
jgi:hypothetical protein